MALPKGFSNLGRKGGKNVKVKPLAKSTAKPKIKRAKLTWREQKAALYTRGYSCPFCLGTETRVLATFHYRDMSATKRRRECELCLQRWSTLEQPVLPDKITVIKRNGSREPFERGKLEKSIKLAMVKRLVLNAERFKRLVDGIILQFDKDESPFTPKKYYRDITSQLIGALVLASLKDLDIIGYYRYASVFLRLYDLNGYQTLLDTIDPSTEPLPEQYVGDVTT